MHRCFDRATLDNFHRRTIVNLFYEAQLDICARKFWQKGQHAFFDVSVFDPFADVHFNQNQKASFIMTEHEKK